jgi:TRAP-type C4-dicarboxylate transport system permease small subunit
MGRSLQQDSGDKRLTALCKFPALPGAYAIQENRGGIMRVEKLIRVSKKITAALQKIEIALGVISLLVLFIVIIANVVGRYIFYKPIAWSDELSNYLFIWMCFAASAYVMSLDAHVRVTAIVSRLPLAAQKVISLIMNIIMFTTFFIYIMPSAGILDKLNRSNMLRVPLKYVYFIIPFFSVLMCIHIIINMLGDIHALTAKTEKTPQRSEG